MRIAAGVMVCVLLVGCADQPKLVPVRLDGQPMPGNPVLQQAFETDRQICWAERQKASLSGTTIHRPGLVNAIVAGAERDSAADDVLAGCMAQRGYTLVREDQAEARVAQLRANAAAAEASGRSITTGSVLQPAR